MSEAALHWALGDPELPPKAIRRRRAIVSFQSATRQTESSAPGLTRKGCNTNNASTLLHKLAGPWDVRGGRTRESKRKEAWAPDRARPAADRTTRSGIISL